MSDSKSNNDVSPDILLIDAKEFPEVVHPFLRWQVRRWERRPMKIPLFTGRMLVGHRESSETVRVQRLIGFGSTKKSAEAMARRSV